MILLFPRYCYLTAAGFFSRSPHCFCAPGFLRPGTPSLPLVGGKRWEVGGGWQGGQFYFVRTSINTIILISLLGLLLLLE